MSGHRHPAGHRRSRGMGLFDAMVALAILSFGLLAMTRFQGRMVAQTTETQSRQVATQFAAEHLSTVLVDVGNAACYTKPQSGTCTNADAITRTTEWATRTAATLPAPVTTSAALDGGTGRLTVTITWKGKDQLDRPDAETNRTLVAQTDVRP